MNTKELFQKAIVLAEQFSHEYVTTDHVFHVLCTEPTVVPELSKLFDELGVDLTTLTNAIHDALENSPAFTKARPGDAPRATLGYERFYEVVRKMAMMQQLPHSGHVSVFNILTELLFQEGTYAEFVLEQNQLSVDDILMFLEEQQHNDTFDSALPLDDEDGTPRPFSPQEKPLAPGKSLEKYCTDLTQLATDSKINKLIGRDTEIADIAQILSRQTKNNAILVGEAGVGKTQIVEGLALAIAKNKVPSSLNGKKIMALNVGDVVAGAKFRGDFEQRIKQILDDLTEEHILFIDEIHTMMGAGAGTESPLDMANLMKPKLSRGEISVIGATTYKEYRKHFVKDEALSRRFLKIDVKEPTAAETRKIINGLKAKFEKHHDVTYSKAAFDAVMTMSSKYIQQRFWPDKAIDLIDAAGARLAAKDIKGEVGVDEIAFEVSRMANLPVEALIASEATRMRSLKDNMSKQVFGQENAVTTLNDSVLVARAGIRGKSCIQGGYLFVGPSGCGKTEIAKSLATNLNTELIRFDMSEFSEKHTVATLVGSPPGYIGHSDSEGKLIEALQKQPSAILLFDEVEKAHPDVFNLFLQMLDEGHITSVSSGKTVSMQNITIIMTTNLGAKDAKQQGMGYLESKQDDGIDKAVKKFFRPEFLNRLDGIVKFNTLQEPVLKNIARKFIKELNVDTKERNVTVEVDTKAISWIAKNGNNDAMGARPMKRLITEHIKKPLASEMLFGSLENGGVAKFTVVDDKLVMKEKA